MVKLIEIEPGGAGHAREEGMKRWPIIRHVRYFYWCYRVNQHYDSWGMLGSLPVYIGRDYEVLDAIWRGEC